MGLKSDFGRQSERGLSPLKNPVEVCCRSSPAGAILTQTLSGKAFQSRHRRGCEPSLLYTPLTLQGKPLCGLAGRMGSIYVSFSLLSASFCLAFSPPIPTQQQRQLHGRGPDSDLSTSSLGFTGSLAHCQVQRGFNSGGDEIGLACCSGWLAPAKVVFVSCQLNLCQSSNTLRSDRLPSHCPYPHLIISAPPLHPHVQFIYFMIPLSFASLLVLLCLLHHKVRLSAFEML